MPPFGTSRTLQALAWAWAPEGPGPGPGQRLAVGAAGGVLVAGGAAEALPPLHAQVVVALALDPRRVQVQVQVPVRVLVLAVRGQGRVGG